MPIQYHNNFKLSISTCPGRSDIPLKRSKTLKEYCNQKVKMEMQLKTLNQKRTGLDLEKYKNSKDNSSTTHIILF